MLLKSNYMSKNININKNDEIWILYWMSVLSYYLQSSTYKKKNDYKYVKRILFLNICLLVLFEKSLRKH